MVSSGIYGDCLWEINLKIYDVITFVCFATDSEQTNSDITLTQFLLKLSMYNFSLLDMPNGRRHSFLAYTGDGRLNSQSPSPDHSSDEEDDLMQKRLWRVIMRQKVIDKLRHDLLKLRLVPEEVVDYLDTIINFLV